MTSREQKQQKKLYRVPRVVKYGDLQEITRGPAKGGLAQDGGGGGPKSKATGKQ